MLSRIPYVDSFRQPFKEKTLTKNNNDRISWHCNFKEKIVWTNYKNEFQFFSKVFWDVCPFWFPCLFNRSFFLRFYLHHITLPLSILVIFGNGGETSSFSSRLARNIQEMMAPPNRVSYSPFTILFFFIK